MKIFEEIPHPVWTVLVNDGDYIFETNNKYYEDLVGFSIKNTRVMESGFNDEGRNVIFNNYNECIRRDAVYEYEEKVNVRGIDRWWLTRMAPDRDANGQIYRLIGISTEITDLKLTLQNLEQFVYIISHDMQTPINSIAGLAGLLEEKYGRSDVIELIEESAQNASKQISGLLEFSRSSQVDRIDFKHVDVNDLVDKIVHMMDCKNEITRTDLHPCFGNAQAIFTVFQNIISNACKFSDQDPIIKISSKIELNYVVYSVADNGIGIASEEFDKIFQPFRQGSRAGKSEGSGLGLSIALNIIHRHSGTITVESPNEMEGSTFNIRVLRL